MDYINGINIQGIDVKFLLMPINYLKHEIENYCISFNLYDTERRVARPESNLDKILKAFGVVILNDYIYFCRVSDDLWRLIDYANAPEEIIGIDSNRTDADFLKEIGVNTDISIKLDNFDFYEYKFGNRHIIAIIIGHSAKSVDENNVFWFDTSGNRYSPSSSSKSIWFSDENCFTLFDIYARLSNSNTNFDENSEVYFFGGSFRNAGYRLSMNADLVRFLTKIRCLRRGK